MSNDIPFEAVAVVAPRTVTEISEGKHEAPPKRKRKTPGKNSKVLHIVPRQDVWAEAKRLASGHVKRILVLAEDSAIVCNSAAHRDYLRKKMKQ